MSSIISQSAIEMQPFSSVSNVDNPSNRDDQAPAPDIEMGHTADPVQGAESFEDEKRGCLATCIRKQRTWCFPFGISSSGINLITGVAASALGTAALVLADQNNYPAWIGGVGAIGGGIMLVLSSASTCCLALGVRHYAGNKTLRDALTEAQNDISKLEKVIIRYEEQVKLKEILLGKQEDILEDRKDLNVSLQRSVDEANKLLDKQDKAFQEKSNELQRTLAKVENLTERVNNLLKQKRALAGDYSKAVTLLQKQYKEYENAADKTGEHIEDLQEVRIDMEAVLRNIDRADSEEGDVDALISAGKSVLERVPSFREGAKRLVDFAVENVKRTYSGSTEENKTVADIIGALDKLKELFKEL